MRRIILTLFACLHGAALARAASFDGTTLLTIQDPDSNLTWTSTGGGTLSFWFRLVLPSGTSLTADMALISERIGGSNNDPNSYLLFLNRATGNLEFRTRGSAASQGVVIERPFLDRWYHLAVTRNGASVLAYVDGNLVQSFNLSVTGSTENATGLSIGGWGSMAKFRGDIQEVRIFSNRQDRATIRQTMLEDLDPTDAWPGLRGYFKLAVSDEPAEHLKNFANDFGHAPPEGFTDPAVLSGGVGVTFEETDRNGEQSLFDAKKNSGKDAITPLSGSFAWDKQLFYRAIEQLPFEMKVGYRSSNQYYWDSQGAFGQEPPLGPGWSHSLETRLLPALNETSAGTAVVLRLWDGNQITWDYAGLFSYRTRSNDYQGELSLVGDPFDTNSQVFEWVTPTRLVYRFKSPYNNDARLLGRLFEIRDFAGNSTQINLHESGAATGKIDSVTDASGAIYDFQYAGSGKLESIGGLGWSYNFTYGFIGPAGNQTEQLKKIEMTPPESGSPGLVTGAPHDLATDWEFGYGTTKKLLTTVKDPRGVVVETITYDNYGRKITVADALGRQVKTAYHTPTKFQTQIRDERGNAYEWITTYDRKGRVIAQRDPVGNEAHSEYDEASNLIRQTDARGAVAVFEYDERSNLTLTRNALGHELRAEFHPFFNVPVRQIDPEGWEVFHEIDWDTSTNSGAGNVLRTWDALGTAAVHTYDSQGRLSSSTHGNGNTTSFGYSAEGFRNSVTVPGPGGATYTTTSLFNEWGWPTEVTNALGETVRTSYNLNGQIISVRDALGREFRSEYDEAGNLTKQFDGKGANTLYSYNNANERIAMTSRSGAVWNYEYSPTGKPLKTIAPVLPGQSDAQRYTTERSYDEADRVVRVTDAAGNSVAFTYDANGNVVERLDKTQKAWKTRFDELNRVVEAEDPLGNVVKTEYDRVGRRTRTVSPKGFTSENVYDGRGRLAEWVDPCGSRWLYGYDANGNITKITDALGGEYLMEYGPRNERIREENQDHFVWTYEYDELGRLKTETDPNGLSKTHDFDAAGRKLSISYSTGRADGFQYDANDNVVATTRSNSGPLTISFFDYDVMDRLVEYRDPFSNLVGYAYDALGRRTILTYPGGHDLVYQYDAENRVIQMDDWLGNRSSFEYDDAGRLTKRVYPNGIEQVQSYDDGGRVVELAHQKDEGGSPVNLIAYRYAFDANGNITEAEEEGTLKWEVPPELPDEVARFTASGRLIDREDRAAPSGVNNFSYTYDDGGNLISMTSGTGGEIYTLGYDEDNRTVSIIYDSTMSAKAITNRYDSLGRRISRVVDGLEARFVHDFSGTVENVIVETSAGGQVQAYLVHGPGGLGYEVAPAESNAVTCFHGDSASNVVFVTDSGQLVIEKVGVTPFGRELSQEPTWTREQTFAGLLGVRRELSVPGLFFMRARYYSSQARIFLSVDPVKRIGPGWQPLRYAYSGGNPLVFVDPSGEAFSLATAALIYLGVNEGLGSLDSGIAIVADSVRASREEITVKERNRRFWEDAWGLVPGSLGMSTVTSIVLRRDAEDPLGTLSAIGRTLLHEISVPNKIWRIHENGNYLASILREDPSHTENSLTAGYTPVAVGFTPANANYMSQSGNAHHVVAGRVAERQNRDNITLFNTLYGEALDAAQQRKYVDQAVRLSGVSREDIEDSASRNGRITGVRRSRGGITIITHERRSAASIARRDRDYAAGVRRSRGVTIRNSRSND